MLAAHSVVTALALAGALQDTDPNKLYQTKLRKIWEELATKHNANASFCAGKKQHGWAHAELLKAAGFDPANSQVQKKLGMKKSGDEWVRDPDAKIKTTNELEEDGAVEVALKYSKMLDEMGIPIAKKYVEAAKFAEKNDLGEENAVRCWRLALEYDPHNKDARKKFGFEQHKESGQWRTAAYTELLKAMQGAAAAAAKGAASAKPGEVEQKTGIGAKVRRTTDHFHLESTVLADDRLAGLAQQAEGAYASYVKLMKKDGKGLLEGKTVYMVYYQVKAEHDRFVESFISDARMLEMFKKSGGAHLGDIHETQNSRSDGFLNDFTIHSAGHSLAQAHLGRGRAWLQEGLAYVLTQGMNGSAETHCTAMQDSTSKGGGKPKDFKEGSKWRATISEMVKEFGDPPINSVISASMADLDGSRTVKAWSVLDYLIREHGDRFVPFIEKLAADEEDTGEKAIKEIFGWTLPELDERWRAFVRLTY